MMTSTTLETKPKTDPIGLDKALSVNDVSEVTTLSVICLPSAPRRCRQPQNLTPTRMVSDGTGFSGGQVADRRVRAEIGLWEAFDIGQWPEPKC